MFTMSRRQFTLDEKIGIIGRLENGEKNSVITKEFGTSSSTISTIWKNQDSWKNMFKTMSLKTKRLRSAQYKDLEEAVLIWFKQQRCTNVPISGHHSIKESCCHKMPITKRMINLTRKKSETIHGIDTSSKTMHGVGENFVCF
jgi:hypothetical protein